MSNLESYSDEQLLALLSTGSHKAFEEIYNRYWLVVYRRLYKKLQNKQVAEEFTQDLFAGLWTRRSELQITSLIQYLNGAVRNMVINSIRDEIRKRIHLEQASQVSQSVAQGEDDRADFIQRALGNLPQKTGAIIKLSKIEGYSVKEIAEKEAISQKAVEYHITKALKMLRNFVKDIKNAAALLF